MHPIMPLSGLALAMFFFVFFGEHRFLGYSTTAQIVLISAWACIFFAAFYWFSGKPMNFLISRNIPFALNSFILISAVAFVEAGFAWALNWQELNWRNFLCHGFSTQMAFVPVIVICAMFFEGRLRRIYGHDPAYVPFWWPVSRNVDTVKTLLPKEKQGKVLMLKSSNQYVEVVTEKGTHELRATMKSLLESISSSEGIRLHRSIWMRKDQIAEFKYNESGNPCVVDVKGDVYPISRNKVGEVRRIIDSGNFAERRHVQSKDNH